MAEKLKRQRGGVRSRLTVLSKLLNSAIAENDLPVLEEHVEVLSLLEEKLAQLDSQLHDILQDQELELDVATSVELQEFTTRHKARIKRILNPKSSERKDVNVKLPKLQIKQFCGDVTTWQSFY
ncbi:Uncharacterised protein g2148 [Pycnogonum litorale]